MQRLGFVATFGLVGCFALDPPTRPPECSSDRPCETGSVCIDSHCRDVCRTTRDCDVIEACIGGVCSTYVATCGDGAECAQGWFCDAGACRRDLTLGSACTADGTCSLGHCVDGVCCDHACDGSCESCLGLLNGAADGACLPVPAGQDPEDDCAVEQGCDGAAACMPGDDLGVACERGSTCESGFCVDGVCCDGPCDGTCTACSGDKTNLASGVCAPVAFATDPEAECPYAQGCDGLGVCRPGDVLGTSCVSTATCESGACNDGVCCDRACDALCETCGADGRCVAIAELTDPGNECPGALACTGASSCQAPLGAACIVDRDCGSGFCASEICSVLPPVIRPPLLWPPNGFATGSVHVAASLVPTFKWRASSGGVGLLTYTLQIDDTCALDDFDACTFPTPEVEVTTTAIAKTVATQLPVNINRPVGRRYFWRVRACDSQGTCSPWSAVRYVDVGRLRRDFNGDGYADLSVGAPGHDVADENLAGAVALYYGSPAGIADASPADQWLKHVADSQHSSYGNALAGGDVNADGYGDLIGGDSGYGSGAISPGRIFVHYGGVAGLNATGIKIVSPVTATSTGFGSGLSYLGDMDGDGYGDIAVGAPFATSGASNEGHVYIYRGGPDLLSAAPERILDSPANLADAHFGTLLADDLDFDGDGFADLVSGEQNGDNGRRHIYVYFGHSLSLPVAPELELMNPNGEGGGFGHSLASGGDLDADGYGDLVVGAPTEPLSDARYGAVFILFGNADRTGSQYVEVASVNDTPASLFGFSVSGYGHGASTDTPGILVGAPYETVAGIAYIGRVHWFPVTGRSIGNAVRLKTGGPRPNFFGLDAQTWVGDVTGSGHAGIAVLASVADADFAYLYSGATPVSGTLETRLHDLDHSDVILGPRYGAAIR